MFKYTDGQDLNHFALDPVHLLILDYDVTRFHSFDLFRWCMLDKTLYSDIIPELAEIRKEITTVADMVDYYRLHAISFNPLRHFNQYRDAEELVNKDFLQETYDRMLTSEQARCTETDLSNRLDAVFNRKQISTSILQMKSDPHIPGFINTCKVKRQTIDSIFDLDAICETIVSGGYTALICGSAELLLQVLMKLVGVRKYRGLNTVMICKYSYNYEWHKLNDKPISMLRYTPEFAWFETNFNINFGMIDPFTGLTHRRAMLKNTDKEE